MAIQESDIMDFGNGIIGDDTFDVWRKKTNGLKVEIDTVNTSLTNKINTDVAALSAVYVPIAGAATSVSTALQLTSPLTLTNILDINGATLTSSSNKLVSNREFDSSIQLTSPKVKATSKLILGTKEYTVPSSPAINNAVLTSATTAGQLQWRNAAELFSDAGGLQQTTAVFEEVMPVGAVIACAEDPNDSNFLECNGGSVLKSSYPKLYDVLKGTAATARYGETTTAFTLPNYSGRVLVGTGTAGSVNFGTTFGVDGGDTTISYDTNGTTLTGPQSGIQAHRHEVLNSTAGNVAGSFHYGEHGDGVPQTQQNFVGTTGPLDATDSHDHSITVNPANRIQPYVTVKYYIKAIENSKVDFKINVNNSGLKSTDGGGTPQTLISVSNETHSLSINPDNTSIALDNNFKVSVKSSPTIPGNITTTGPDFKLNNTTRAGGNSHLARALVHGGGDGVGDPILNDYNRKVVKTINDSGVGANNDTLIINYNDISPNSVGDYTGGVIINGMKAIMFEDGSILQSGGGSQKGNFKKATESESGKHHTVAPQYSDSFAYIDDEDDIVIGGNANATSARGASKNNGNTHRTKFMLPDDEAADKLYITYYNTHVIAKSGKSYSVGYGYSAAPTSSTQADHAGNTFHSWTRSFCESDNCKMSKIVASGDIQSHVSFALDEQGYLWGHGVSQYGVLANGTTMHSSGETLAVVGPNTIIGKRESLANSETTTTGVPYNLAENRRHLAHVMNPMLTSGGAITTNPAAGVSLLKVTDATAIGSFDGYNYLDTIAIISENKRVHVAGYCNHGQDGAGVGPPAQYHWSTVQTSAGVPLENITKLYSGGEDQYTYFVAIDENHDVWGWGNNVGKQFANNSPVAVVFATKIWDSSSKNRRANYVITNNAGTNGADAVLIIASHQDSAGATINKEFHMRNSAGTAMIRLSHTVFNTSSYSIQDLYFSNGNAYNFYYVLARNTSTNKLELWSSGYNEHGQLGYQDRTSLTHFANVNTNGETEAYRVNFRSDLLEKVVAIHCCRQYNTGGNTFIHLADGRIFAAGYLRWSFDRIGHSSQYHYKFSPIPMD